MNDDNIELAETATRLAAAVSALIENVDALGRTVGTLIDKVEGLGKKVSRGRTHLVVLAVSVALDLILSGGLLFAFHRTDQNTADIIAQRTQSRITACDQTNIQTAATIDALESGLVAVVGMSADPARQVVIDKIVADYDASVKAKLVLRDCTPAGIIAYYGN